MMKRLKQIFSIVLLIVLVGSSTIFAVETPGGLAANELVSLGVLAENEEGNLLLEKNVTRAEMTVIICRILALEETAIETVVTTPVFSDVPLTHWAAGYLQVAKETGIVNGYPDGSFCPEQNVSYVEALKMLIAACGYLPKAEQLGEYPMGVIAVAMQNGITNGVTFEQNQPATLADVACFTQCALDVPLFLKTGFGSSAEYQVDSNVTLRSQNFREQP